MMNAKDIDVRPMHYDKVSAFWALNAKFTEAFAGTPIFLKNTKEGKVYRLDEEGKQLGIWTDATMIADSPKEKCMINLKKINMPMLLKEQKLHSSCCIQFDSTDGYSTVCSKEKVRCWEDVRRFGRYLKKMCLIDRFEKAGIDVKTGLTGYKLADEAKDRNNSGDSDEIEFQNLTVDKSAMGQFKTVVT